MIVGVPKEILEGETRVALTPAGVAALVAGGHEVIVEAGAGSKSGFGDEEYAKAGAETVPLAQAVWGRADLIVKVKGPIPLEFPSIRKGQVLFAFLHLAASKELTDCLLNSGCVAVASETVQIEDGSFPVLSPMSRIAGRLAVQDGSHYLLAQYGGKGTLMGSIGGVPPARVVILGAGMVGMAACRVAVAMGASVTLLDIDLNRLMSAQELVHGHLTTLYSSPLTIAEEIPHADLAIGAVYVVGARSPRLVSQALVKQMESGSVIVDVAVDQGACFETIRPTSPLNPTYNLYGVIHYGVINMPAQVPRTSTLALTNVTLPYVEKLANQGWEKAVAEDTALKKGLNIVKGEVVHPGVAEAFGLPCGKV